MVDEPPSGIYACDCLKFRVWLREFAAQSWFRSTQVGSKRSTEHVTASRQPLSKSIQDGMTICVGLLQVRALHLPGLSPKTYGYLVGPNLFRALSICYAAQSAKRGAGITPEGRQLASSLGSILSLPRHFRILPDQGQQIHD
ncbi:hypothetical protein BDY17DRAFT_66494 [Neohortaea acidophila]|uniref:Uncharacterized protein n=1 Tax=Neohortaea acidophila TaxID=245834 RepID=A0A6A6PEW3_9PEZI|nr:uncharacterized protein BDY17DRAFT_66494 [Neohortaea acidophila]KAF2478472.1 hypothetical protein BDY17DRAFT_66494 [Neohortaea acidophila]